MGHTRVRTISNQCPGTSPGTISPATLRASRFIAGTRGTLLRSRPSGAPLYRHRFIDRYSARPCTPGGYKISSVRTTVMKIDRFRYIVIAIVGCVYVFYFFSIDLYLKFVQKNSKLCISFDIRLS